MIFVRLFHWNGFNNADEKIGLFWICLVMNAFIAEFIIQFFWKTNSVGGEVPAVMQDAASEALTSTAYRQLS